MGIGIAILVLVGIVGTVSVLLLRTRRDARDTSIPSEPARFDTLRLALDDWITIKAECLNHDLAQIRSTGSFVPRLPEDLATRSADASHVLNRVTAGLTPGEVREQVTALTTRADEIFTEEALNPDVVTEAWLLDRLVELTELSGAVDARIRDA